MEWNGIEASRRKNKKMSAQEIIYRAGKEFNGTGRCPLTVYGFYFRVI